MDFVNSSVEEILHALEPLETPEARVQWLIDEHLLVPISINGTPTNVLDYHGRLMVIASFSGARVPFYVSTGRGKKHDVAAGCWYAFFGMGELTGWLNKTSGDDMNEQYGVEAFQKAARVMDEGIGRVVAAGIATEEPFDFNDNLNWPWKPFEYGFNPGGTITHVNRIIRLVESYIAAEQDQK